MTSLRTHPYKPLFLPALLLLVSLAGYRTMKPRNQEALEPLRTQRDRLRDAKARLSSIDPKMAATLRARLQAERQAIAAIEANIPKTENLPGLMRRMHERAAALQLRMGDIEPVAESPLAAPTTNPYAATAYAISVRGRWAPLTQLMNDMAQPTGEIIVPVVESVKSDSAGTVLDARFIITLVGKMPPAIGTTLSQPPTITSSAPNAGGVHR
ncbi:MAG: type 4a pilus biogenesis protein PilO [Gemmatimonadaceae bacterium]|nr:type 4a pilus biogenesis protein PilO [Gemmatimonadaceae bacterium]